MTTPPDGSGGNPIIIGLTGPIGCGKSTVAAMLAELGGIAVDADVLAREATAPGEPASAAIRDRFGDSVFERSGTLDRAALGVVVFADADALSDLEAIVHPGVRQRLETALATARANGDPFVSVEAIKLIEGGLAERCDEVWLVTCDPLEQVSRLRARGMASDDIERRIGAQGTDLVERLRPEADLLLSTSGSPESVRERVQDALADVLAPRFGGLPMGPVEMPSGRR
jgi:dephospho-CoA kinase